MKAVQTLSRLNRTCPGKDSTFILDFVNRADDIQDAFKPFYRETILDQEFDIDTLYDTRKKYRDFDVYNGLDGEKQDSFRALLRSFIKQYRYIAQITRLFMPPCTRNTSSAAQAEHRGL